MQRLQFSNTKWVLGPDHVKVNCRCRLKVNCRIKFRLVCQLLAKPTQILFNNSLLVYLQFNFSCNSFVHDPDHAYDVLENARISWHLDRFWRFVLNCYSTHHTQSYKKCSSFLLKNPSTHVRQIPHVEGKKCLFYNKMEEASKFNMEFRYY